MADETINLNDYFKPREYQLPIFKAFEEDKYKKLMIVMGRRAGKDVCCFNLMVRAALRRVGIYYYILPNAVQARRVMFDGMTIDGQKIIDYIPKSLVSKVNIQQMKITFINDSIIQFVGSENYNSLRGTNPVGCVFSEYAYCHPASYPTVRPILLANNGFCIFISTPFGENHFFDLYNIAKDNPHEWFTYLLPASISKHISQEEIQREIESGEISPDMAAQEYEVSFSVGARGAYYSTYLNKMELSGQIGRVAWEPDYPVHSAWDIGMADSTSILMFQIIDRRVNIIDMYQNENVGLEHYVNYLQSKEYTWGTHIAPHDIKVREFTSGGLTRQEKAARLGINFVIAPSLSIMDGIESVRTTLPRMYIDEGKCKTLIAGLRNYRKEYDAAHGVYKNRPLHDKNSHVMDSLRYLCTSLPLIAHSDSSPEELEKRYQEAMYGRGQSNLPPVFRTDLPDKWY
jgi:phage terminase large subunit